MATLQIQRLQKYTNVGSLRAALGVLPTTVDGIYDAAIHRIESDDWSEDALRILSYLVHARRPLALEELQHFLAVQPSHTQLHEEYITDRDTLVSMCAGLVVVDDKTRIIRLVHYTAQEYLDKRQEARFSLGDEELGRICLAYLSFDEWRIRTKWDALQRSKILSRYALLDYIVHYWHLHVLNHQEALQEPLSAFLKNDRLIHAYHHWCHFLKQHQATTFDDLADQKGIHVAAASGLLLAVEWLIPDNHRNLRTTLISASEGGHIAVVKMLLQHGVDVDAFDRAGDTALTKASLGGHDTMVKLLFEHGADAEARTRFAGGTALTIASEYGHSAVVKHLLEHGANIEACTPFECTGLMIASQRGHDTVVKLLLEHGADIEAQDKYHSTALIWASQCGEDVVVNLLLEHGADIEAQDKDKCTALLMATRGGHVEVMKLLLEHGANIETQGKDKRTPLLVAAHHSSREMVELLLEHGADSEAQDKDECTALILATRGGYVEVVKLLLVYGADIEAQDKDECTAAIAASICGYGAVMELLLEHGADFSIKGDQWRTALVAASRRDDTAALHLLLENGGDEDESWRDSWHTALIAAIYRDFKKDWTRGKVVKLLLGKGDARGGKDRTASRLIAASADGDEAAVQKLLAGGGEVNTEFRHPPTPDMYPTALIAALCAGHAATVKLLLQHGADVSTLDIEGKTALTQASRMGYDAVVEVLLQHGADVNAASDYYGTALRTAFMSGHTEVVKVLLTHIILGSGESKAN
ncbi:ankyrin repeat-containing domain protein [Mycena latifolia]|nr:ankyrin repeat-containing domain protein [Mycena latifolia]